MYSQGISFIFRPKLNLTLKGGSSIPAVYNKLVYSYLHTSYGTSDCTCTPNYAYSQQKVRLLYYQEPSIY